MSSIYVCSDIRISKSFSRSLVSHTQRLPHPSHSPSLPLPMGWAPKSSYSWSSLIWHLFFHFPLQLTLLTSNTSFPQNLFPKWTFPRMSRLFHASRSQFLLSTGLFLTISISYLLSKTWLKQLLPSNLPRFPTSRVNLSSVVLKSLDLIFCTHLLLRRHLFAQISLLTDC